MQNNPPGGTFWETPCFRDHSRRPQMDGHGSSRPTPMCAVLFDLDGVLFDNTAWQRWLLRLLLHLGLHTQYAAFFRLWDREYRDEVDYGERDRWEALRAFLLAAGLSRGQVDEVEAASRPRFRELEQNIRPFLQVRPTLAQLLAQGQRLAIAGSTPLSQETVSAQLDRLRLSPWFPDIFSSRDLPRTTERKERFQTIARNLATSPGEVAYVGRDPAELRAAARAGLLAIAFNQDADATADIYLDQFDRLPQLFVSRTPARLQIAA